MNHLATARNHYLWLEPQINRERFDKSNLVFLQSLRLGISRDATTSSGQGRDNIEFRTRTKHSLIAPTFHSTLGSILLFLFLVF